MRVAINPRYAWRPPCTSDCESLTKRVIHVSARVHARRRCRRKGAARRSEREEMAFSVFSTMKTWECRLTIRLREWRRNRVVEYLGSAQVFLDKGLQVPLCYGGASFTLARTHTHTFHCSREQKFCINIDERYPCTRRLQGRCMNNINSWGYGTNALYLARQVSIAFQQINLSFLTLLDLSKLFNINDEKKKKEKFKAGWRLV